MALSVVVSLACAAVAAASTNWGTAVAGGSSAQGQSATMQLTSTIASSPCNSSASGATACASGSPVPTGSLSSSSSSSATTALTAPGSQNGSSANVASASCGVAQMADTGSDSSWGGSGSNTALAVGGLTYGASGPLSSTAITLNGSTGWAETTGAYTGASTFTILAWFKTTASGSIIGYSNNENPGAANNYDRMLWVDSTGHVVWGIYSGSTNEATSSSAYANGSWHLAAASFGSAGMQLYVDGALAGSNSTASASNYSGWWSIGDSGVTNNGGWPDAPSSPYFNGSLAQMAIIPSQLSATQVSNLYSDNTLSSYTSAVNALSPVNDWALNDSGAVPYEGSVPGDSASTTLADASGNGNTATAQSGVTLGASGPPALGGGIALNGSTGWAQTANSSANPQSFSVVDWFKTSSSSGGTIIGFTNVQSNSGQADWDRMLWVDNSGKVVWGVNPLGSPTGNEITSSSAYNNGQWHMAVAEIGPSGMQLWVDGTEVASNSSITTAQNYTGYWHLGWGAETSANWADVPSDVYLTGSLSQISVIPSQLTATQIGTLENAGSAGAYTLDVGALSPTNYWPLEDSASNVCGTTEVTVQQTVGSTSTCIFPAGSGTCGSPSSSSLLTGLGVRSITAPTAGAPVTIRVTLELSGASPAGVLGLHELPDISYGAGFSPSTWTAQLAYPYAFSQL
jgi:hypothetical protein